MTGEMKTAPGGAVFVTNLELLWVLD